MLRQNTMVGMIAFALVAVGCNNTTTPTDSGSVGNDTGTPGTDSGTPGTDSGTPGTDSGTPGTDSGTPGTDSGTPAVDGGSDAGSGPSAACTSYCTAITAACTGDTNRQYGATAGAASDSCLASCAGLGWAAGTAGAMDGDSLACRTYHATAAATAASTHCPHAGPLGGATCGTSNCADFCAANLHVCTGDHAAYTGMDACVTACNAFSDATTVTSPTATGGNTLACRMYHLTAAIADPATHCAHTSASGGGVCN